MRDFALIDKTRFYFAFALTLIVFKSPAASVICPS
jgi:hypothetical protein